MKQRPYSRRTFLRETTLGTAAAAVVPVAGARAESVEVADLPPIELAKDLSASAPALPVGVARCRAFEVPKLAATLEDLFDRTGGLRPVVGGKTVTVKLNTTGDGRRRLGGRPAERTYQVHPNMIEALCGLLAKHGAKRIYLVESYYRNLDPAEILKRQGWKIERLMSAGDQKVLFEDTRNRGSFDDYVKLSVPWGGYIYPAYHLNRRYQDTDVVISIAKLKNHANAGFTGAVKNLFGIAPTSLYGNDSYNERSTENRGLNFHFGRRKPPAGITAERYDGWGALEKSFCAFHRVPRVTADLFGARPADLSIVEGIESCKGGEGPWIPGVKPVEPGLVVAGRNGVNVDAVCVAAMGYDPLAGRGEDVWRGDNHLELLAKAGIGAHDPGRIDVTGLSLKDALYEYSPGNEGWVKKHLAG